MASPPDPASLDRPWVASYPPGVPPTYRLPAVRLPRLLDDAARDFPEQTALIVGRHELRFDEFRRHADLLADAFAQQDVGEGDRVLVMLPTGVALPIVLNALWYCGAVAVPLPADAPAAQAAIVAADAEVVATVGSVDAVASVVRQGGAGRLAITVSGDEWSVPRRLRLPVPPVALPRPDRWVRRFGPWSRQADVEEAAEGPSTVLALADLIASAAQAATDPLVLPGLARGAAPFGDTDDHLLEGWVAGAALLAVRLAPEGITAVEHTHRTLLATAFQSRLWVPDIQAARERMLVAEPLHDVVGLAVGLLAALLSGATTLLLEDPSATTLARAIERQHPTLLVARSPRVAGMLADGDAAKRDLTSLRVCLAVGDGLSPQVVSELEGRSAGARVRSVHGCGDAAPVTHGQPVYGRMLPTTMGLPVTDTLAIVVDPEDLGSPCPAGEPGLLLVRGPQIAEVGAAFSDGRSVDGWLITDEYARVDEGGWFTRLGQPHEWLDRDGDPVPAARIAAALCRLPEVQDAEVVLVDQQVIAAVVSARRRAPHPDDLLGSLVGEFDGRALPDRMLLVTELPRTPEDDIDREVLEAQLRGLLGGHDPSEPDEPSSGRARS